MGGEWDAAAGIDYNYGTVPGVDCSQANEAISTVECGPWLESSREHRLTR